MLVLLQVRLRPQHDAPWHVDRQGLTEVGQTASQEIFALSTMIRSTLVAAQGHGGIVLHQTRQTARVTSDVRKDVCFARSGGTAVLRTLQACKASSLVGGAVFAHI